MPEKTDWSFMDKKKGSPETLEGGEISETKPPVKSTDDIIKALQIDTQERTSEIRRESGYGTAIKDMEKLKGRKLTEEEEKMVREKFPLS